MREKVYVCKKCGYVLLKRDAVVSGWDAEGSSTHVHCPGCGKNHSKIRGTRKKE